MRNSTLRSEHADDDPATPPAPLLGQQPVHMLETALYWEIELNFLCEEQDDLPSVEKEVYPCANIPIVSFRLRGVPSCSMGAWFL